MADENGKAVQIAWLEKGFAEIREDLRGLHESHAQILVHIAELRTRDEEHWINMIGTLATMQQRFVGADGIGKRVDDLTDRVRSNEGELRTLRWIGRIAGAALLGVAAIVAKVMGFEPPK